MKLKDLFSLRIFRRRKPNDENPHQDIKKDSLGDIDDDVSEHQLDRILDVYKDSEEFDVTNAWRAFRKSVGLDKKDN